MHLQTSKGIAAAAIVAIGLSSTAQAVTGVRVIIENRAPDGGTWLTPVWVGFHDGGFDVYDPGFAASDALERLAEDGNADPLSDAFVATGDGSVQGVLESDTGIPPLAPGETATMTFVLDEFAPDSRYFSYASMVIPSNDAFVANEYPLDHRIFDASGNFLGAFITIYGTAVQDAGTEVNDEVPEHTAFFGQTEPDTGVDEFGVVHAHPGYVAPGSGGILDDPMFADADFAVPVYEIARIIIVRSDTDVPSGAVSGTWDTSGSPYLVSGDIVVPSGETLVIDPGVYVVFLCQCRMFVEGTLHAIGTEQDPITFTRDPGISGWGGLRFFYADGLSRMSHCTVEWGDIHLLTAPFSQGAGIHCDHSAVHIDQCNIRLNWAVDGGGIFSNECDLVLTDSDITQNLTPEGVGGGIMITGYEEPLLVGNRITDNFADSGAGIAVRDADALIIDNLISNNEAYDYELFLAAHAYGAGIHLSQDANAFIAGNLLVDNYAHAFGNVGTSAEGGAIRCFQADPILVNNTIVNNVAQGPLSTTGWGGAVATYNGYPRFVNNILWNNEPQELALDTFAAHDAMTVRYSDVQGGEDDVLIDDGFVFWLEGNLDVDPWFVDADGDDFRLLPGSPCVDAGDPDSTPDADGSIRDLGAFPLDQSTLGDLDGDGIVDLDDITVLATCLAGPGADTPPPGCTDGDFLPADLNGDRYVDLGDYGVFQQTFGAVQQTGEAGACCLRGLCFEAGSERACTDYAGTYHGPGTVCPETACDYWEYRSETYLTIELVRPGAGRAMADDMTLTGSGARELVYYDLLVYAFDGGYFDATVEIWDGCPGDGGEPIPGTQFTWTDLPDDNSAWLLEAELDHVPLPETVWMVVSLSTDQAGWFVAGEPQKGYTEDLYAIDGAPWSCAETLDTGSHAGFWARLRCE